MRSEPLQIAAGDSVKWLRSESDYPASEGWALHYSLVNSSAKISFQSSANGDDHEVIIAAAQTSNYQAGSYRYQVKAKKGSETITLESGKTIDVLPDYSSGPMDARTQNEIALDAIRATLANKASKDQLSITVEGRTIARMNPEDLIRLEKFFANKVRKEQAAASGQKIGGVRKIYTRFKA